MLRFKHALAAALGAGLLSISVTGCDSAPEIAPVTGSATLDELSPVDGRPVVRVGLDGIAHNDHLLGVRDRVAELGGPVVARSLAGSASASGTVLVRDVFAAASLTGDAAPSTHLSATGPDGERSDLVLTLVTPGADGSAASLTGNSAPAYLALDPDLFGDVDVDEVDTFELDAVSLADGAEVTLTVDQDGGIVGGANATASGSGIALISGISYVENEMASGPFGDCDPSAITCGGPGGPPSGPGTPPPPAPRLLASETEFLAVFGVQLSDNEEWGPADVTVYTQPTNDFSLAYQTTKNYRFDQRVSFGIDPTKFVRWIARYYVDSQTKEDSVAAQFEIINRALSVDFLTINPNVRQQGADDIAYDVIDVNSDDVYYSFNGLRAFGAAGGKQRLDGFPLFMLDDTNWRGLFVEQDGTFGLGYDKYGRKGVGPGGVHTERLNTYDFGTGAYQRTDTKVRFGRRPGSSDDIMENSGYRGANRVSLRQRVGDRSRFNAQTSGFRYEFGAVPNRLVVSS